MSYFGCIYKITNILNNKIYIGQTIKINPFDRINRHFTKQHYYSLLYKSYFKNNQNKNLYKIEIICSCQNLEDLNYMEIFFIKYFNCLTPNGYNLKSGGKNGGKCSNELKAKLSKIQKGKPSKGRAAKGVPKSKEHCQKMSEVRKGFTSENRKKSSKKNAEKRKIKFIATNIKTGLEICYYHTKDCAIQLNLNMGNISKALRGKENRSQHKGWKFQDINNKYQPLNQWKPKNIFNYNNKYIVIINKIYFGSYCTEEFALCIKTLYKNSKYLELKDFLINLKNENKIKFTKKKFNKLLDYLSSL